MVRVIPPSVIASWPVANYTNPVIRGPELVYLSAVFIAVVAIAVFLRLYTRIFMLRRVAVDDVFILLAFICTIGMTTCTIVAYEHYGWDRHIWDTPFSKFTNALYLAWWTKIVYSSAACFTRLSLLCFYYKLTIKSTMKWYRRVIHGAVIMSVAAGLALILFTLLQCKPMRAFWGQYPTFPPIENQKCLDDGKLTLGCGIVNSITDLIVVVLPIPLIARLALPLRDRVGAIILVSLGFIVCIAGAIRAYYTWYSLIATYDDTWNGFGIYVTATIEIDLGVICACAPALRLVFVKIIQPRLLFACKALSDISPLSPRIRSTKSETTSSSTTNGQKSIEELEMAATYAYRRSPLSTPAAKGKEDLVAPSFNETTPLGPPPTDAQVLRANLRREKLLTFQGQEAQRSQHQPPQEQKTTIATAQYTEENISTSPHLKRTFLIEIPTETPLSPLSLQERECRDVHVAEQSWAAVSHNSSVIDLSQNAPSLNTVSLSTSSSSVGLAAMSVQKSPTSTFSSLHKKADTLRLPERTLKLARGFLFDFDGDFGTKDKVAFFSATNAPNSVDNRDRVSKRISFLDDSSRETLTATPTARYVKEQHTLLRDAIVHDRARALSQVPPPDDEN